MTNFLARTDWIPIVSGVSSWSFAFPYLDNEHVYVYVRNAADDHDAVAPTVYSGTITFLDANLISLVGLTTAQEIQIRRITPSDDLLTRFDTPGPINKLELNDALLQLLYVLQEAFDLALSVQDDLALLSSIVAEILAALDEIRDALTEIRDIASAIAYQYDIGASVPYPPNADDTILTQAIVRPITLPADATGSTAVASAAPSGADAVFSIQKNGVEVGTVTFPDGSTTPAFVVASAVDFAAGDRLSLVCTTTDNVFENFGITLRCARNGDLS